MNRVDEILNATVHSQRCKSVLTSETSGGLAGKVFCGSCSSFTIHLLVIRSCLLSSLVIFSLFLPRNLTSTNEWAQAPIFSNMCVQYRNGLLGRCSWYGRTRLMTAICIAIGQGIFCGSLTRTSPVMDVLSGEELLLVGTSAAISAVWSVDKQINGLYIYLFKQRTSKLNKSIITRRSPPTSSATRCPFMAPALVLAFLLLIQQIAASIRARVTGQSAPLVNFTLCKVGPWSDDHCSIAPYKRESPTTLLPRIKRSEIGFPLRTAFSI